MRREKTMNMYQPVLTSFIVTNLGTFFNKVDLGI
jgi:hypothetical protein